MPVAVRLVEFSLAFMLFLLVTSAAFLLYCAENIVNILILISSPLLKLIRLVLHSSHSFALWFADMLFVIVSYLSGNGEEF